MKTLPSVLLILWPLLLPAQNTEINVRFKNYDPGQHKAFLSILVSDVFGTTEKQFKITDDGLASCQLELKESHEAELRYDSKRQALLLKKGDRVSMTLDILQFLKNGSDSMPEVSGGKFESANLLLLTKGEKFEELVRRNTTNVFMADKSIPEMEYFYLRTGQMMQLFDSLEHFLQQHKIQNPVFEEWARGQILFGTGHDLSLFPFMGKVNQEIHDESPYFKQLIAQVGILESGGSLSANMAFENSKGISHPKTAIQNPAAYHKFIGSLFNSFNIIGNISHRYKPLRDSLKANGQNNLPIRYAILDRLPDGQGKQLLMAKLLNYTGDPAKLPAHYFENFEKELGKAGLERQAKKSSQKKEAVHLLKALREFDISEEEKAPLLALYENGSGKIVFHDFWFKGCSPCMIELPKYNSLIEKAGPEVDFVFFGVFMEEAVWKKTLEEYGLKGKHHLLTKNQLAFYEQLFGIQSYPHHKVMDVNGLVADDDRFLHLSYQSEESVLTTIFKLGKGQ